MGTHTAGLSEYTYSFLAPWPGEGRCFLFFGSRRNSPNSESCLENKSQGLLGSAARAQTLESDLVKDRWMCPGSPGTAESSCPHMRHPWKPSGFVSKIIKQSYFETCLLARDALSAWISSIPKFLQHVLLIPPPKSLLTLVPLL